MQSAAKKTQSAPANASRGADPVTTSAKLSVYLVTRDDSLWPQIGPHIAKHMILKQVDSVDELLGATGAGQQAVVLWDARNQSGALEVLSRLHGHSTLFAVAALDEHGAAATWAKSIALQQLVAHIAVPVDAAQLTAAIDNAQEEVRSRQALLGEDASRSTPARAASRKTPWLIAALLIVGAAAVAAYVLLNRNPPIAAVPAPSAQVPPAAAKPVIASDEKVDVLIEQAQQAMLDRHFIDPAQGSALSLYRNALLLDPDNGEAKQGLQRLAEILFSRVQSSLDERKFDVALQSLETARSINPADARLAQLDERIAALRAEVGPAQILAAISAQNFDRAALLIEEASRNKSLSAARLAQLREELHRRREEADLANSAKLIDTRLQQDRVTEPREDSAVYYWAQARAAGTSAAALQPQYQEIYRHLSQSLRVPLEQRHFADADRMLAEWQGAGVPTSMLNSLQREVAAARTQQAAASASAESRQAADLAQSRLVQGRLVEPDNDSALFYFNQLRGADPKNAALPALGSALQTQILQQARSALDSGQTARAEMLLQASASIGASADASALSQRLVQVKSADAGPGEVPESSLTRIKGIELQYPLEARSKGIEGWVDLTYGVAADGKVVNIAVTNASPAGVFDQAASRALSRVRYQPPLVAGKPAAVTTKLRLTFRLAK